MHLSRRSVLLAALMAVCLAPAARAAQAAKTEASHADEHTASRQAPMPHKRQNLPPSFEQRVYGVTPDNRARPDLADPKRRASAQRSATTMTATADCKDMNKMAGYSGSALADYLVSLPDYACTYPLYSVTGTQASTIFSPSNFAAVANRFVQEAAAYNGSNLALVNVTNYLRAGYYVANAGTIAQPSSSVQTTLRPAIKQAMEGYALYQPTSVAPTTAGEVVRLITNMHDEAYFLPSAKNLVVRYTNTSSNPSAAQGLRNDAASGGFTSALTVIYYAHFRPDAIPLLQNDASYVTALNNFLTYDKSALLGTETAYQLTDAARETFRFWEFSSLAPTVKSFVKYALANNSMMGADQDIWLQAASAVDFYDSANCSEYGTCNYKTKLADAVLVNSYICSPTIRIRAQALTADQMQQSCSLMAAEETLFHNFLVTNRQPVANDNNTQLEVVVFDNYSNYDKYASVIYGINTNNGGMYLEGDPGNPSNQARFVAYRADWLPTFQVWNLNHEYVHYLDGRFDMMGDFAAETVQPTVWWIEGLAEYISKKNDNQESIDIARTDTYKLSTIFGNTYSMNDYVTRAYRWGYMSVRFMFENHRSDMDAIVAKFRVGDYTGYQAYMNNIGTRYDTEFYNWVHGNLPTTGDLPMPNPTLPPCSSTSQLGKNCSISGWSSSSQAYAYILLPTGAKNVKIWTSGGSGDVDLYLALDRYPTTTSYDAASVSTGNNESVSIPTPVASHWYYIVLKARQPFSGVTLSATYD